MARKDIGFVVWLSSDIFLYSKIVTISSFRLSRVYALSMNLILNLVELGYVLLCHSSPTRLLWLITLHFHSAWNLPGQWGAVNTVTHTCSRGSEYVTIECSVLNRTLIPPSLSYREHYKRLKKINHANWGIGRRAAKCWLHLQAQHSHCGHNLIAGCLSALSQSWIEEGFVRPYPTLMEILSTDIFWKINSCSLQWAN